MSLISAPQLLRTPRGYPQAWKHVFEAFISPIILVRALRERADRNAFRDKAIGKETEPWLSSEEFQGFREEALEVRRRMRETLQQLEGLAEKTWRAGCEISNFAGSVLFPLTDELHRSWYPEPVLASIRKQIIDASLRFREIPLLEMLRDAISVEKSIMLPDATQEPTSAPPARSPDPASRADAAVHADQPALPASTAATLQQRHEQEEGWLFVPDGDGYFVSGFGESGHLSMKKGLVVIARLIATPGDPVSMLTLDGAGQQARDDRRTPQPALDAESLRQAHNKLQELRADLDKAKETKNTVEIDQANRQIEEINATVRAAMGRAGKARDLNNPFDRMRAKIHGQLQTAYGAMRDANPPMPKLAKHLETSISSESGTDFAYRPAGNSPAWKFEK
jgi:hypothetical protein